MVHGLYRRSRRGASTACSPSNHAPRLGPELEDKPTLRHLGLNRCTDHRVHSNRPD